MNRLGTNNYQRRDRLSNQIMTSYQHYSGFKIDVLPRDGFSEKFAAIAILHGTSDAKFIDKDTHEEVHLPLGSLHLLAHMIFEADTKDSIANNLAKIGISGHLKVDKFSTIFYINTVDFYQEAVKIILRGLLEYKVNESDFKRAKKDVLSELSLLKEDTDYSRRKNVLKALYNAPELYESALGTRESLNNITLKDLETCQRNLFAYDKLALILAGEFKENILVSNVIDYLDQNLLEHPAEVNILNIEAEPKEIVPKQVKSLSLSNPSFDLAYRYDLDNANYARGGKDNLQLSLEADIYLKQIIGLGTNAFEEIRASGLLGERLDYKINVSDNLAYLRISGSSLKPELSASLVAEYVETAIANKDFSYEQFKQSLNSAVGSFIKSMDSVVAYGLAAARARINYIDFPDYAVIFNEVEERAEHIVDSLDFVKPENRTLLICYPETEEETAK